MACVCGLCDVGGAGEVGNVDVVRSWVASGADINVVNEEHHAVDVGLVRP